MSEAPPMARAPASPPAVDPHEAQELLDQGGLMVDVREGWELEGARVPAALHVPMMELPQRLEELPRDRTLVMLCASGARSQHAARMLAASGYPDVVNLRGGIMAWHRAGLPIRQGPETG